LLAAAQAVLTSALAAVQAVLDLFQAPRYQVRIRLL
jgi:hypothetical protein